jgi:mRNA interferase RelE/StbE
MKTIVFSKVAAKQYDRLALDDQDRILAALIAYAGDGRGDVKALGGRPGYRLRVGTFRVIFDEDQTTILAIEILRRSTTTYR